MRTVPSDIELLRPLALEAASRPIRHRKLEVIDYQPSSDRPEEHLALAGTITVLLAKPGSKLLMEIRSAVAACDNRDRKLAKRLYKQYANRYPSPLPEAVKVAQSQPVFADLRYGGATLAPYLFVPKDLDVAIVNLPYNGGRLARGGFSLAEHPRTEEDISLDVLVLRNTPPLSKAEVSALAKVPEAQRELNVGAGPGEVACSVVLLTLAVVAEVAVVAVTFAITGKVDLEHMEHIEPDTILQIGPSATARMLVSMRRKVLLGQR
jgi:hypothetical protein